MLICGVLGLGLTRGFAIKKILLYKNNKFCFDSEIPHPNPHHRFYINKNKIFIKG
jgi:hypothetical protein